MAQMKVLEIGEGRIDYGAPTLRRIAQKYTGIGLTIAVVFHLAGVGAYWGSQYLSGENENVPTARVIPYIVLGPPPSVTNQQALPQVAVSAPMAKPNVGVPIPVPDAQVSPDQTIMTQRELNNIEGPANLGDGNSGGIAVSTPEFKASNDDSAPPSFLAVEKYPQMIKEVQPKFPDLALRAGVEGRVFVNIWVDKDGRPHKAVVVKSDAEIFNQAAINAAMECRFTPGIMNKGPVAVWVTVPFTFKIKH